jgi:hypothetical protein
MRISSIVHYYTINSSVKKSGDDDADLLKYFSILHASCSFLIFSISVYVLDVVHRLLRTIIGVLFNINQ